MHLSSNGNGSQSFIQSVDIDAAKDIIRSLIAIFQNDPSATVTYRQLAAMIGKANIGVPDENSIGKRHLGHVMSMMSDELADVPEAVLLAVRRTIKAKPSRTVSGVATVSVLTRPNPCRGNCAFCPNDLRMPKSYLHDEPACMRAERCFFDPYLQVASRLAMLEDMGHDIGKIELLVLGSTWHDYPEDYRIWFTEQLFAAANEFGTQAAQGKIEAFRAAYVQAGFSSDPDQLAAEYAPFQSLIDDCGMSYSEAYRLAYRGDSPISRRWDGVARWQTPRPGELEQQHAINETAGHRIVGFSIETRPDAVTVESLIELRRFGVTKVQMGVQSTSDNVLESSNRSVTSDQAKAAVALARTFGFKLHLHFMANLPGCDVGSDKREFAEFITSPDYCPDELKIYPCALIAGTDLMGMYKNGTWKPYGEEELQDLICHNLSLVKPYTRVSRVIRDFSADDIVAGSKVVNMRQLAEEQMLREHGHGFSDIRSREVKKLDVDIERLHLEELHYKTSSTDEVFLQFVNDGDRIAGFLRLSFPDAGYTSLVRKTDPDLPIEDGAAMIREVHVYGNATSVGGGSGNVQHKGLGTRLVERAMELARDRGCRKVSVISSVGTRKYYEKFGFEMDGLYQSAALAGQADPDQGK